ncbi:hypothetical protein ACHAXT_003746 [Thalassiosira profunda]
MKLLCAILLLGAADADKDSALPPGYEDNMWCPPDTCQIYRNPYGYVGGRSSFEKCYDPQSDRISSAVWTGSETDVEAPRGWVEDPPYCTAEEYSECDSDYDCSKHIDYTCTCYASSRYHPYDPCKGDRRSDCNRRECTGEECDYNSATCELNGGGGGYCTLEYYADGGEVRVD